EVLTRNDPGLAAANKFFRKVSETRVDPAYKSVIGRMAGKGAFDDTEAKSRIYGLLNKGTNPKAEVSEIKQLGRAMNKQDPAMFRDVFKSWLADTLEKTLS